MRYYHFQFHSEDPPDSRLRGQRSTLQRAVSTVTWIAPNTHQPGAGVCQDHLPGIKKSILYCMSLFHTQVLSLDSSTRHQVAKLRCAAYDETSNNYEQTDNFVHYFKRLSSFGGKNVMPRYRLVHGISVLHTEVSFILSVLLYGGFTVVLILLV